MSFLLLLVLLQTPDCPCASQNAQRAVREIDAMSKHLDEIEQHVEANTIRLAKYDERTRILSVVIGIVVAASATFQVVHRRQQNGNK